MSRPLPNIEEMIKAINSLIADVSSVNYEDLAIECNLLGEDVHASAEEMQATDTAGQPVGDTRVTERMFQAAREIFEAAEDLKRIDFDEIIGALDEADTILTKIERAAE